MRKLATLICSLTLAIVILGGFTRSDNIALDNWQHFLIGDPITTDSELYYLIEKQDQLVSNSAGTGYWDTMITDDSSTLYSDLDMSKSSSLTEISKRLRAMTISYSTPNSKYYNDPQLLADIIYGLQIFNTNFYNTSIEQYDNWWDFEIGTPLNIDDTLILLDGQLDSELTSEYLLTIDKHIPDPSIDKWGNPSTGANLLDRALAKTLRYVIVDDKVMQEQMIAKIDPAFEYVTSGDGFYEDGGFIQHDNIPYIASYGGVLIYDAMKFELLTENTTVVRAGSVLNRLEIIIENNYMPFLYDSGLLFSTRGRSVARSSTGNSDARKVLIASYVISTKSDDASFKDNVSSFVKYQIENDEIFADYYSNLSLFDVQQLDTLLNDDTIVGSDAPRTSKYYNSIDMLNYYGDDYLVNLRLFSPRISSTEIGNGENKLGHMQGAGTTYIYNGDQNAFNSEFVTTINPYNYPGTTTDYTYTKPDGSDQWGAQINSSNWAGGTTATTTASATLEQNLDLITSSDLQAKKSWFFFDQGFVSLATDISASADTIDTTVANTKLADLNQQLFINNEVITDYTGAATTAFLENISDELGTGYYFYGHPNLHATVAERTGNYADINDSRDGEVTETFASILIDNSITNSYAYTTFVNTSQAELETYETNPDISILQNDSNAQAVYSQNEDTLMINSYGQYTSSDIETENAASIIVENATSSNPQFYVSDPSQSADSISITIKDGFTTIETTDNVSLEGNTLIFDVSNHDGNTLHASIS